MVITQIGRKKLGGHHACLGDIVRNISKMGVFCLKSNQISIFPINFTNCQFNCIAFVMKHRNLSKIIILPSRAEELRTAKRWNDLKRSPFRCENFIDARGV